MSNVKLFWDMDGTLAQSRPDVKITDFYKEGYFANLLPENALCEKANELAKCTDFESYILTSVLDGAKYAMSEKLLWLQTHIPCMSLENVLFAPYGVRKSSFIEDLFHRELSENDILVDDHSPNLIAWENAGGKPVKWINSFNNTGNSSFTGIRVKEPYYIGKIIETSLIEK